MRPHAGLLLILFAAASLGGPLALGLAGLVGGGRDRTRMAPSWDLRLSLASALTYALALNLVFFLQELFLVLPKAATPGLRPVLYHNNHDWTGANPVARLLQGTGVLADLALGLAACAWVALRPPRTPTLRLLAIWIAYAGLFQGLPQLVAGAILPQNDLGMAMDYLGLGLPTMWGGAVFGVLAMALAGLWLARRFLELGAPADLATRTARTAFAFRTVVLPAALGVLLILPFRAPGSLDQVVLVPVFVAVLGVVWILAAAWRFAEARPAAQGLVTLAAPALALAALLVVFQFILRRGVAF